MVVLMTSVTITGVVTIDPSSFTGIRNLRGGVQKLNSWVFSFWTPFNPAKRPCIPHANPRGAGRSAWHADCTGAEATCWHADCTPAPLVYAVPTWHDSCRNVAPVALRCNAVATQ